MYYKIQAMLLLYCIGCLSQSSHTYCCHESKSWFLYGSNFTDQDLPNNMIHQVAIKSLPQEWLWCETWCDDNSKTYAKTIDLVSS